RARCARLPAVRRCRPVSARSWYGRRQHARNLTQRPPRFLAPLVERGLHGAERLLAGRRFVDDLLTNQRFDHIGRQHERVLARETQKEGPGAAAQPIAAALELVPQPAHVVAGPRAEPLAERTMFVRDLAD